MTNIIETAHLLPILDRDLITLLRSLDTDDGIAHFGKTLDGKGHTCTFLDGNVRTLSLARDTHVLNPGRTINSYRDLVDYLNSLNAEWVAAMKRLSPTVLIELLELTGDEYSRYIATVEPDADSIFSVTRAGEQVSKNWFDIAREYAEKWHHQQQIREAGENQESSQRNDFFL